VRAIVLFARSPQREAAAKRLPHAARLFRGVVSLWIDAARQCDAAPLVACDANDRDAFAPELGWIAQGGGTFGERVARAAEEAFARGFGEVIVAAIDAPPRDLHAAFASLDRGVAVVSPSRDGGINYIGLVRPERALLETFIPRDRTLLARCSRHFGELFLAGGTIDIDDARALDLARGDRAWSALLAPSAAVPAELHPHVLRGVDVTYESRPPPI
jgi:Uncharacterized protein conserved in bacteria (DUF2064)